MIKPIILELDEQLAPNEEMIEIRTIQIKDGDKSYWGYVGVIKNFSGRNDIRLGNLKARIVETNKNSLVL
jgi:hypothetical protein